MSSPSAMEKLVDGATAAFEEVSIKAKVESISIRSFKGEDNGLIPLFADVADRAKFETEDIDSKEADVQDDDRFPKFEEWLLQQGAEFPDLYLKNYAENVRGVHAKCTIDAYQTIVSIPLRCLITDEMGKTQTEIGREVFSKQSTLSTPNLIAVVIYILETRQDPSNFYQPYYKILPSEYTNFPIFWSDEMLQWLQGSPLLGDIADRKHNMRNDYEEVCALCEGFRRFSFEEFLEVRTAVGSRNFGIVVNGEKRTAMVPHADMLNHYRPRETSWTFDDERQSFTITSLSSLIPDQQVMDSYGKKCNSKFLLHYGFAVELNREEDGKCQNELYTRIALRPATEDVLRNTKASFLGINRVSRGFRISMNVEDKSTSDALSYLRVVVANEEEMSYIMYRVSRQHTTGSNVSFVSMRNEVEALSLLADIMEHQLEGYPETYEENQALLASGDIKPFSNRRTGLIVVLGEQEICDFWINTMNVVGDILCADVDILEVQKQLKSLPRNNFEEKDRYRYATTVLSSIRNSVAMGSNNAGLN